MAVETGSISGRVTDASTGLALGGVRVSVANSSLHTYTGPSGEYLLVEVPAGSQSLEFAYVGYSDLRQALSVNPGATATLNTAFNSSLVTLEPFVIKGARVGQARAINAQRAASTLTSLVASDEIGRFPDQNAAESLQRVPGVSLYRDQGEGRFVDLRGLNYIYTGTSLNGVRIASPELGDRSVALDVVPSDALAAIEVTKVPTPDMDAEGLGGSVNMRTRSPFDRTEHSLEGSIQSIYTRLTNRNNYKANATWSDQFLDGRLGILTNLSWQERDFGSQNYEEDGLYAERSAPLGSPFLAINNLGFRDYVINRERYGANATVEFRPDAHSKLSFSALYNRFTDTEDRHQLYLPFERGSIASGSQGDFTATGISRVRRDLRIREKDQELSAFNASYERTLDSWKIDAQASYSHGLEKRPGELTVRFRRNTGDTGLSFKATNTYDLLVTQTAGASIAEPANYTTLDRMELAVAEGTDREFSLGLNARRDLQGTLPSYLKGGLLLRLKNKESDEDITRFKVPSSFTFANMAEGISSYPFGPKVPRISHDKVLTAFNGSRSAFTPEVQVTDSAIGDWASREDVSAAYLMGGVTWNDTSLLAGARLEHTRFKTEGKEVVDDDTITGTHASRSYTEVLPGLHLRHDFNKNLVGRASLSRSLMRPSLAETALYSSVANDNAEIERGNPELKALTSTNFDASLEYYMPSLGLVSIAGFAKEVKNFSYQITVPGGDSRYPGYDLISYRNGSKASLRGVELAYQQQLRMLPAPFDSFGFMANLTLTDAEASYPTRPDETLPLIGQSKHTGNLAITFERGRFFARLALNFRSEHLREDEPIGTNDREDRWIDDHKQLDLSTSLRLSPYATLFAEISNLANEPFRVYVKGQGTDKRFVQHEEYGWSGNAGIRLKF